MTGTATECLTSPKAQIEAQLITTLLGDAALIKDNVEYVMRAELLSSNKEVVIRLSQLSLAFLGTWRFFDVMKLLRIIL
jgi:hypothetical protein